MISKIKEKFIKWCSCGSIQSELECYINSHNPKNLCDIERLTEEFERRRFLQGDCKL
jgi:hypothetical protein